MFASPIKMINEGYVKNLFDQEKQVQPNAIDWTVDFINYFEGDLHGIGKFYVGEDKKVMRQQRTLDSATVNGNTVWKLNPNSQYDVMSNVYVRVPEGYAALLVLRSTFVRNGCWLASGLYDSGFEGNIGAVLHTGGAVGTVQVGTRLGQIIFVESQSAKLYAGGYNTADGVHWQDKVH